MDVVKEHAAVFQTMIPANAIKNTSPAQAGLKK
jgi:hypothetical protein